MSAGSTTLQYALKNLRQHWEAAKEGWQDQVRHDFERNHIQPLEAQVSGAIRAMDRLAEVTAKMRRECS